MLVGHNIPDKTSYLILLTANSPWVLITSKPAVCELDKHKVNAIKRKLIKRQLNTGIRRIMVMSALHTLKNNPLIKNIFNLT